MFLEFTHVSFAISLFLFILAGIIGRHRPGAGVLTAGLLGGLTAFLAKDISAIGVLFSLLFGLGIGVSSVIVAQLFKGIKKGDSASNLRFMNFSIWKRPDTLHFNWIRDDNLSEPDQEQWTDKDYD